MPDARKILHSPKTGESLEEYLQSFSDVELQRITANLDACRSFSEILQKSFKNLEEEEDLQNLWNVMERLNNFKKLQRDIAVLSPVRNELLKSLEESANQIDIISRSCTFGRIFGSTVDIAGTIGGLWLKESSSPYTNWAFRAATSFGLLSLFSTIAETRFSNDIFSKLIDKIERDQQLVDPIKRWYQQCEEVEEAMMAIFPFKVYDVEIQKFFNSAKDVFSSEKLLSSFLSFLATQGIEQLRDEELIRNLIIFTSHPASQGWYEWFIFYRHPIILDITRIVLQLQSNPDPFTFFQFIPALPVEDQNMQSLPVLGRIGLNLGTICGAVNSLRKPTVASAIRRLRKHLFSEMAALDRIVKFVSERKNRQQEHDHSSYPL